MVEHNLKVIGTFTGGPLNPGSDTPESLMFVENPNLKPDLISPFHMGITRAYMSEYNLELQRHSRFKQYPSRFFALFLLKNIEDALTYKDIHSDHVKGRVLKRGITNGLYRYSEHDASWIDFLRLGHSIDNDTMNHISDAYWLGQRVQDCGLGSHGKPWTQKLSREILFYGSISFPDRDFSKSDVELGS